METRSTIIDKTGVIKYHSDGSMSNLNEENLIVPKQIQTVCSLKNYHPIQELGQGSFSHVWQVQEMQGDYAGRLSALKVLRKLQHRNSPGLSIVDEAKTQIDLYNATKDRFGKNLVPQVYDFDQHWEHNGYILMEAFKAESCLASMFIPYGIEWLETITNVAKVHQVIHEHGKHNGDLKRRNAIKGGIVIDFGSCGKQYEMTAGVKKNQVICTLGYASPEQLSLVDSEDSRKTDVFSLGVMAYMLASGKEPYEHPDLGSYKHNLFFETPKKLDRLYVGVPSDIADLVKDMMEFNPINRPSITEVVETLEQSIDNEITARKNKIVDTITLN